MATAVATPLAPSTAAVAVPSSAATSLLASSASAPVGSTAPPGQASAPLRVASIVCSPEGSAPGWVVPAISSLSGGAFAIAVLWLGHVFTARRELAKTAADRESARKSFLRDKLEQILTLVDLEMEALNAHALYIGSMGVFAAAPSPIPDEVIPN
jgi:hypothetical protein